jgi:hypothetical protein
LAKPLFITVFSNTREEMMQTVSDLKILLLEILESAFQDGSVQATQQMGVSVSNAMKREGMVIIQNQNVEVVARIMPSLVRAIKLCDAMESNRRDPIEIKMDAQPKQLPSTGADVAADPLEVCCAWLFENRIGWQEMQDLMRARYLDYVLNRFKTKNDAAKWLGVGNTYLCKLSKTVPRAVRSDPLPAGRRLPSYAEVES